MRDLRVVIECDTSRSKGMVDFKWSFSIEKFVDADPGGWGWESLHDAAENPPSWSGHPTFEAAAQAGHKALLEIAPEYAGR